MSPLCVLLVGLWGLSEGSVLPPASDLERWESRCWQDQPERCTEHLVRLRHLRSVHGWSRGLWDDAIEDTKFSRDCWITLESATEGGWGWSDFHKRRMLAHYKHMVGAARYKNGWAPTLIPPASKFRRLYPAPPNPPPQSNPVGANGGP